MNRPRKTQSFQEVKGLILFGMGLLFFLSLISYDPRDVPSHIPLISAASPPNPSTSNYIGLVGTIFAGYGYFLFGAGSYLAPILLIAFGIGKMFRATFVLKERLGWSLVLLLSFCALMAIQPWFLQSWKNKFGIEGPGGWFGNALSRAFSPLGSVGAILILSLLYFSSLILATGFHPIAFVRQVVTTLRASLRRFQEKRLAEMDELSRMELQKKVLEKKAQQLEKKLSKKSSKPGTVPLSNCIPFPSEEGIEPKPKIIDTSLPCSEKPSAAPLPPKEINPTSGLTPIALKNYVLPSVDVLDPPSTDGLKPANPEELRAIQDTIIQTLQQFSVESKPGDITKGPTITRYEIYPADGIRVDRILSLEKDIARATRAERINILAPIPGKDTVGIEIANSQKVKVTLRELFETDTWLQSKARLPLALGKDVYGQTILADLAQMPHLLVAGTTGSGKSVCINALIASLLFRYSPQDLRFIMIDPKVVEMQIYNKLPHLITPVVTDPKRVLLALRWVIEEMEDRYRVFAACGVRNIHGFNSRPTPTSQSEPENQQDAASGSLETTREEIRVPRDSDIRIPDRLEYIVVIIDELADLMQTAPADVENAIARITQMARAAGIHMIVATQTPRADIVTGIIKANIPSRIAFQVASKIDSRVILDENGAEKLLGQGDMLYLPPGTSKLSRAQGVLVTDEEIRRLVDFLSVQSAPRYEPSMQEKLVATTQSGDVSEEDEQLLRKCLEIIQQEKRASTSMLQRRLRLGYTRAARIVDLLEQRGILGPKEGTKDREILIDLDSL